MTDEECFEMCEQFRLRLVFSKMPCTPQPVPTTLLAMAKTYREACRYSLALSPLKRTYRSVAEIGGFTYQHVTDWFNADDKPTRRPLPAHCIPRYECDVVMNTFLSQWLARQSGLTVLEELQVNKRFDGVAANEGFNQKRRVA